jgi:hypothetical protein
MPNRNRSCCASIEGAGCGDHSWRDGSAVCPNAGATARSNRRVRVDTIVFIVAIPQWWHPSDPGRCSTVPYELPFKTGACYLLDAEATPDGDPHPIPAAISDSAKGAVGQVECVSRAVRARICRETFQRHHGIWNRLSVQPRGHRLTLADRSTQLCRKTRIPRPSPNAG